MTITRNEILTGINSQDQFILALEELGDGMSEHPRYVRQPFVDEPDFAVTGVSYCTNELLKKSEIVRWTALVGPRLPWVHIWR